MSTALTIPDPGVKVEWSDAIGAKILDLIGAGTALHAIERIPGMPNAVTIYEWRERHPDFGAALSRARAVQASRLAEESLAIVDEPLDLQLDGKVASAGVSRGLARANHRRWLAGCLDRDTYGERPPVVAVQVNPTVVVAFSALGMKVEGE